MSSKTKYLLLEVSVEKHDELVTALLKRDYIKLGDVNELTSRKKLSECPACLRTFSKVSYKTVDEDLLWDLLALLRGMVKNRALVLHHQVADCRPIDKPRMGLFSDKNKKMATTLGLISKTVDGSTDTWFVNQKCIDFINGPDPLKPAILAISGGRILEISGELNIEQVKAKEGPITSLVHDLRMAVEALPDHVIEFIKSGQVPLL